MKRDDVRRFLETLPPHVLLVAAAKERTPEELLEAIEAGVSVLGENYVDEAERAHAAVGSRARWHFIGHLQRNKVKRAIRIFDMIETVDSRRLAEEIDRRCAAIGKTMPVLVEVNSGREPQKAGVLPEEAPALVEEIEKLEWLRPCGLMTMGPRFGDPEKARPYFQETKRIFDQIQAARAGDEEWRYLSMGMSNTYTLAIEEGANIVRIGTLLFGERTGSQGPT